MHWPRGQKIKVALLRKRHGARLPVSRNPPYTPLCYLRPLLAWVCMSIRLPMFSASSCDCDVWPARLTFEIDLDCVTCLDQMLFRLRVIDRTNTHTHTRLIALRAPVPVKLTKEELTSLKNNLAKGHIAVLSQSSPHSSPFIRPPRLMCNLH